MKNKIIVSELVEPYEEIWSARLNSKDVSLSRIKYGGRIHADHHK